MKGKNIILGVSGGIAAYKSADLTSRLVKKGAQVHVIMTKSAAHFIGPTTFRELTRNSVIVDMFEPPGDMKMQHISLAQLADLFIVAPATANIIGKYSSGIADDMLSTTLLATQAPVLLAPAMNTGMYHNPIVQGNISRLKALGHSFIGPDAGYLACGDQGEGRMVDPQQIVLKAEAMMSSRHELSGQTVLVTAGPTREAIDPVRYITNHSSGKMGYALAGEAALRGAKVILISGPTNLAPPYGVELVNVESAQEMYDMVMKFYPQAGIVIKAAAVADYGPVEAKTEKIKKSGHGDLVISLRSNPDILATLGQKKENQFLVGFAAETNNLVQHAQQKLVQKNLDMIIANDVSLPGAGFNIDTNIVTILYSNGTKEVLPQMKKSALATEIWDKIVSCLDRK